MGNIQMVGKSSAPMFRGEKPLQTKLAPTFTLDEVATHAVDFWLSTEDLGRPENRVTLAKDGSITLSYTPNNQEPKKRLYNQLKSMLGHLGMHPDHLIPRTTYLKNEIPIAGVAHQAGTVRFGTDPATSALDPNCKAHELDNLYVVDTSFFPSIGAVNPALTAIANSLRVGDHLLERLGASAGDRGAVGASAALDSRADARPMPDGRSREVAAVYGAALVQGVALVTFPAASSILTSPTSTGCRARPTAALFLPQAIAAIAASLAGARLARQPRAQARCCWPGSSATCAR